MVNLLGKLRILFSHGRPILASLPVMPGRCKVCGHANRASAHPRFFRCRSCGCYSNYLPNDIYDDSTWYQNVDPTVIERDLVHWRRVGVRVGTLIGDKKFSHIVDLAGGLGLFSAALQEQFLSAVVLVDRCSIPESALRYAATLPRNLIKDDVRSFLATHDGTQFDAPLLVSSHFIEHLELDELVSFLSTLKTGFPGAWLCLYFPNADMATSREADFLHFNTNLPGEHRIVWSLRPFLSLLGQLNIQVHQAEPFDLDALIVCKL